MDIIATNITSPLGITTDENLNAVVNGHTALRRHEAGERGVPFVYCASLFEEAPDFEVLAYDSASRAMAEVKDIDRRRTVFILSSTKGDITTPLAETARHIARKLGIDNKPIVVCNACISGVAAMVLAMRMLRSGAYDYAVVTGADVMSDFIVSGFQALKALSPEPCRPFDIERLGLNLGEAAATIVAKAHATEEGLWRMTAGATANDAYHLTNPHPQGEGAYRALAEVMRQTEATGTHKKWLGEISAHGTATMYNDQMESKAVERCGLSDVPLTALKGYYGHTMGAAGLLETILTMRAMDHGIIPATKGFEEIGVSGKVNISGEQRTTDKRGFIKMMSGFGGANAAIAMRRGCGKAFNNGTKPCNAVYEVVAEVSLGDADVNALYKERIGDYPKFHKMDGLSKMAFMAAEMLISEYGAEKLDDDLAVILFNRTSSVVADRKYDATISNPENHFASPSMFIHTLPNISIGEVAIRHGIHGETSFYILEERNEEMMQNIINATLRENDTRHVITGWIDCPEDDNCVCDLKLIKKS